MRGWRLVNAGFMCGVLAGCVAAGDYYYDYSAPSDGASYSSSSTPSPAGSEREDWEQTSVRPDGTIVENKVSSDSDRERTVIHPDGRVTIIQRDSDGTTTYIDSEHGVRVEPPGPYGGHDWRR